jgi:hypothetical protein
MPALWPGDDPWLAYTSGAVITLGVASAQFADASTWRSPAATAGRFSVAREVDVRTPPDGLIATLPWFGGDAGIMLSAALSEYPLNSSLDTGRCVMAACAPGRFCEYDGCSIRPKFVDAE